jgi:hypothetical protein
MEDRNVLAPKANTLFNNHAGNKLLYLLKNNLDRLYLLNELRSMHKKATSLNTSITQLPIFLLPESHLYKYF